MNYTIAPLRQDIGFVFRSAEQALLNIKHYIDKEETNNKFTESADIAYNNSGPKTNTKEEIIYMLYPDEIKSLTNKENSPMDIMNHAIAMFKNTAYTISNKKAEIYNSINAFRMGSGDLDSVTAMDFETIGGLDENGAYRVFGIYDYAMITVDKNGNRKAQEYGLIGITEDSDSGKYLKSILEKLNNGQQLTKEEDVAFEFISRLGASVEKIKPGKAPAEFRLDKLTNLSKDKFKTSENFIKGYEKLITIGKKQSEKFGAIGGYYHLLTAINNAIKKRTVFGGHNIVKFDIPVLKDYIKQNEDILNKFGFNLNAIRQALSPDNVYDTLEILRSLSPKDAHNISKELGTASGKYGSRFSLEAISAAAQIGKSETKNVSHSALTDVENWFDFAFGEKSDFFNKVNFINIGLDPINEDLGSVIIRPKNKKSKYSKQNNNIYGNINLDGKTYFADGSWIEENEEDTSKRSYEKRIYSPAIYNNDRLYSIGKITRIQTKNQENIIGFQMSPLSNDRVSSVSSIFIPENEFVATFAENFEVVNTSQGITSIGKTLTSRSGKINKSKSKNGFEKIDDFEKIDAETAKRIAEENASRGIAKLAQGEISTLERAYLIRLAAQKGMNLSELYKEPQDLHNIIGTLGLNGGNGINEADGKLLEKIKKNQLWEIDGQISNRWKNNSYRIAENMNYNSAVAKAIRSLYGFNPYDQDKEFEKLLKKLQDKKTDSFIGKVLANIIELTNDYFSAKTEKVAEKKEALGIVSNIKMNREFAIHVPSFFKELTSSHVKYRDKNTQYLSIDLNNQNSHLYLMNSIVEEYRSAHLDVHEKHMEKRAVDFFLRNVIKDSKKWVTGKNGSSPKNIQDFIEAILELAKDDGTTPVEKMALFQNHLISLEESGFKGIASTEDKILIRSSAFTKEIGEEFKNIFIRAVNKAEKQEAAKHKTYSEIMNDFIKDFADFNKDDYEKELENVFGNKNGKVKRRISMALAQAEATKEYAKSIFNLIKNCGGILTSNGDRIYASFDGNSTMMDLTGVIPKLHVNNGTTYHVLNGVKRTTSFNLNMVVGSDKQMKFIATAELKNHIPYIKSIEDDVVMEKRKGNINIVKFIKDRLSIFSRDYIENASVATNTQKDFDTNQYASYEKMLKSLWEKNPDVEKRLNEIHLKTGNEDAKTLLNFIKERRNDPNNTFIGDGPLRALAGLINDGYISNKVRIDKENNVEFNLNVSAKDTAEYKFGMDHTEWDYSDLDNPGRNITAVKRSAVTFNSAKVLKRSKEILDESRKIIDPNKANPLFKTDKNLGDGIEVVQQLEVKTKQLMDIQKNEIRKTLETNLRNKNLSDKIISNIINRAMMKINTHEGGGFLGSRILDVSGHIEGIKKINLSGKEILDTKRFEQLKDDINTKNGISFKYSNGYIVAPKAGDRESSYVIRIADDYSKGPQDLTVNRASTITKRYFSFNSGVELTEEQAMEVFNNVFKAKEGIDIGTKSDFSRAVKYALADQLITEQIVATPITHEHIKILEGLDEKHTVQHGISTLNQILSDSEYLENTIGKDLRNVAEEIYKMYGIDILNSDLHIDVWENIEKGYFNHPIFNNLHDSIESLQKLKKIKNDTQRHKNNKNHKDVKKYEDIKNALNKGRHIIQDSLDFELIVDSRDVIKHENYSAEVNDFLARLKALGLSKEDEDKIKEKVITIDDKTGKKFVNRKAIKEFYDKKGIESPFTSSKYMSSISFIQDPGSSKSGRVIDERIAQSLFKSGYVDDKVIEELAGLEEAFGSETVSALKDNSNKSLWKEVLKIQHSNYILKRDGEHDFNESTAKGHLKEIYNELKNKFENTPISYEAVNDIANYESQDFARKANSINSWTKEEIDKKAKELGFRKLNVGDITYDIDFENAQRDSNFIWKQNAIVDLVDEEAGIDEEYLKSKGLKRNLYLGRNNYEDFSTGKIGKKYGTKYTLQDYQAKFRNIFNQYNTLRRNNNEIKSGKYTPSEIADFEKQNQRIKDRLPDLIREAHESQADYISGNGKGTFFDERIRGRVPHSAFDTAQVFDVRQFWEGVAPEEIADFKYKGASLQDIYTKKNRFVGFAVASTQDLAKYGYTDEYFEKAGINKAKWLEKAQKEGIQATSLRYPVIYKGSAGTLQLYFSPNVNAGVVLVDSVSASLKKLDADGDKPLIQAFGVRDKKTGIFYDSLALDIVDNLNENTKDDLKNLTKLHDQIMAVNSTEAYLGAPLVKIAGVGKKEETLVEKYEKSLESKDIVSSNVLEFLSEERRKEILDNWNSVQEELGKIYNPDDISVWHQKSTDDKLKTIQKDLSKINNKELKNVIQEMQDLNSAFGVFAIKTAKAGTGTMDTPFDVIDQLAQAARSSGKVAIDNAMMENFSYLRESASEGFVSPKHNKVLTTREFLKFSKTVPELLDVMASNVGRENGKLARENLINFLKEYGKDISDSQRYTGMSHEERIRKGAEVVETLFSHVSQEIRNNGTFGIYKALRSQRYERPGIGPGQSELQLRRIATGEEADRGSLFTETEVFTSKENSTVNDTINKATDILPEGSKKEAKEALKNGEIITKFTKSLSKGGWAAAMLGTVFGLGMVGAAGGNPSQTIDNNEAARLQQEQAENISPMPDYSSMSNLYSLRNSPSSGYIINVNAKTDEENEYTSRLISSAINNNYQRSQVNIALNINEQQTSISTDDLFNYFAIAF